MLRLPPSHYHCTGCGDCCRGWDVPLEDGEAETFRTRAGGLVPVERLRGAINRATYSGREIDALVGAGGQCVALAEDQRCLIHAAHGEAQKPRACQIFPLTFVTTPTEVRVGLSFACPAVLDGEGPLLESQRAELEALFTRAVDGTRYLLRVGDEVALATGVRLAWPDARALIDELRAMLDDDAPLARRLCRMGALCALTQVELEAGRPFAEAIAVARSGGEQLVAEALADPPAPDRLSRAMLRTLLRATQPERGAAGRMGGVVSSLFGGGKIRLRDGRQVALPEANRVRPGLTFAGEALLVRWLAGAIESLTFFGDAAFGLSIAGGLDLLVLSSALVALLARAYAASAGRDAVTDEDARAAVRQLDAGLTHRSAMPRGFDRALAATSALDLLREQLG